MSQENVEIVRALFEAWNAGDMEAFRELHDPHVVVRTVEGWEYRMKQEALEAVGLSE